MQERERQIDKDIFGGCGWMYIRERERDPCMRDETMGENVSDGKTEKVNVGEGEKSG